MTTRKSFKRLVRARMAKTGESYTGARAVLLAARDGESAGEPAFPTSDAKLRERTGRGWEGWFDLLDERGAGSMEHREIARSVAAELEIDALAWDAQAITVSYERARGGRAVGQRADGFAVSASKTAAVPVGTLFDAFVDEAGRERLLPGAELRERTSTRPRSARFDWGDGTTRVHASFATKGEERSTVTVEHVRLPGAAEAERMKRWWRERLRALAARLEADRR